MIIRNFAVSVFLWLTNCLVWAAIVKVGISMTAASVDISAHLTLEFVLFVFWIILPYSMQAGKSQSKLQSRIFSGHFLAFAGVFIFAYIFSYIVSVHHILESDITNTGVAVLAASYLVATALIWLRGWASPVTSILVGLVGPACLVMLTGVIKMAATLTIIGSLGVVVVSLLFFVVGFLTNMSTYEQANTDFTA